MPKVLRIINRLNLGGPTYNAAYLTKYLEPDFETILLSGMKSDAEESSEYIVEQLNIKPVYITDMHRSIHLTRDYKAYQQIKKIIQHYKPDIVHTHASKAGTLGRLAAIHSKVPVIVHTFHGHVFHSYFSSYKTKFFIALERYLARKSSAIITLSPVQQNEIVNEFSICPLDKSVIIPLGFELDRFNQNISEKRSTFRNTYRITEDELAIGIIGRLTAIKNHPMFLKSIALLKQQSPKNKIKGVIIGNGEDYDMLTQLAGQLGLQLATPDNSYQGDILFTSWIKEIDIAIAGLDIIGMTSFNEGTPVSLIEAQAGSKPVVSTRVGGIEDIVNENNSAFLCNSDDIETFTQHLMNLCNNPSLRSNMGKAGQEFVTRRFSRQRLVSDMNQLYQNLLKKK